MLIEGQFIEYTHSGRPVRPLNSMHVAGDKDLLQRLSSWLSAPNPISNLNAAQTKRQQDTEIGF